MLETIGEKIKRLRKEMKLTQSYIHHNQSQVALIEKGEKKGGISNPEENTLRVIAKNMEISFDELISDTTWEKPETAFISKEIAFSPAVFNIEIDDSLNLEWSNRFFPLYNDKGEKNEFCPYSGFPLISECEKCGRSIEKTDQRNCFGCGNSIFTDHIMPGYVSGILGDNQVITIYEACEDAINGLTEVGQEYDQLLSLIDEMKKCESPKLFYEELKERNGHDFWNRSRSRGVMHAGNLIVEGFWQDAMPPDTTYHHFSFIVQICRTLNKKLKQKMKDMNPISHLTIDETKARLFNEVSIKLYRYMEDHLVDSFGVSVKKSSYSKLIELMQMLQSGDDKEIVSKMESVINSVEEISEDGNSESAAENETEQANDNAKDKDNKESNND